MRGDDEQQEGVFSYVSLEQRVAKDHPLRAIRKLVDEALAELSGRFDELYGTTGRPSIAPEKLLRALLLQALYGKRSERLLMEELDYSLLFRWFVGLAIDDEVWDTTVFSKNRDRLIEGEIASRFFAAVRQQLERSGLLSDEHFTVDGTMLEAWANRRSFREKADPPERGSGHGGKRLLRDTHESRTDPEARLYRKCNAGAAEPSYLGHVLTENDHGLIVAACVTEAGTKAERDAALALLDQRRSRKRARWARTSSIRKESLWKRCGRATSSRMWRSTNEAICSGIACVRKSGTAWRLYRVRRNGNWWSKVLPGSNTGLDSGR
jgi:transposase